jgi:hypothetical protein
MDPASAFAALDNPYGLAMNTVDQLVEAGNEQKAIDRLTQLLGQAELSDEERAGALYRRAILRQGNGNDVEGAVLDFDLLMGRLSATRAAGEVGASAEQARLEAQALRDELDQKVLTPTERFEILFRLGRHQDAVDLMFVRNLNPDTVYILDMYQIGFLCAGPGLGGPVYEALAPDGTALRLNFCDFGK